MKILAIIGAGGHGRVVADAAHASGWNSIVFFDDNWPNITRIGRWEVVGTYDQLLHSKKYTSVIVAIGHNKTRFEKSQLLLTKGFTLPSIIHPGAIVSQDATVGFGNVIFAGAVINPNATIGDHCIINTHATIEHDCIIESGVHISPGATLGGGVRVGVLSWVGIGACVRHQTSIGHYVIIGAGAAVVNDISDYSTAIGVPAISQY